MIITCENCNKKFNVNSDLIPEKGRLLQCSSCDHKWFFKKNTDEEKTILFDEININENKVKSSTNDDHQRNEARTAEKYTYKDLNPKKNKEIPIKQKKFKILNKTLLLIISFAATIVLIDTFKDEISKIYPNIEFILYNLFESFKDLFLFFKDLI